jgi:uncharacterized protein YlxW (UPF0749 family)
MIQEIREFLENYKAPEHAQLTPADAAEMIKKIKKTKQKANDLEKEAQQIESVLKSMCAHSEKTVDQKYEAGDYYNYSQTVYTVRCLICNSELFTHTKSGKSYG